MEPSRIRAMWKHFTGQVIFFIRNLLLGLVDFPQYVAVSPVNFFSSAMILNLSLLFSKLKASVSETLSGGVSLNKTLRTGFCISKSISRFRIEFQEMKQRVQSGVRIQGRKICRTPGENYVIITILTYRSTLHMLQYF
jgi:hypothetical protein